jgi:hypothetical protein
MIMNVCGRILTLGKTNPRVELQILIIAKMRTII